MITVEEARTIVMGEQWTMPDEQLPLEECHGRVLAGDVFARHAFPLFDMSAVDGFAVGDGTGPWQVVGSLPAGDTFGRPLDAGEAVRIFTGAQVPEASHAVVMQERCTVHDAALSIEGEPPAAGANIRRRAEGHARGDLLLRGGTRLDMAAIGLLAADGVDAVPVAMAPVVGIIRTGGEFADGSSAGPGRIFSSNEVMLSAAARAAGWPQEDHVYTVADLPSEIKATIFRASLDCHLVITTGGVSVGEHDLLRSVLEDLGAEIHFHGVLQKPGKPMLFATVGHVPVFALPGNPRAVLVAWHVYVLPYIRAMQGMRDRDHGRDHLPMAHGLSLKGGRAEFRAARVRGGKIELLKDEGSHLLGSLTEADALAYFPHTMRQVESGDEVEVIHLHER
ncbi:MAG: molybdopterin molybdotransferase MoeA [Flavobacteriales bacterium]|nr:molybdopterin molybdotransferase MoeA [Flavobacteriales bacterium]